MGIQMSLKRELTDLLEKQRNIELKLADELSKLAQKVVNPYARFVIDGMVIDSRKHALWLQAIMEMGAGPVETKIESDEIRALMTKHVAAEEQTRRDLENIIKKVADPKVVACLEQIADDEKRHHRALDRLAKTAAGGRIAEQTLRSLYKAFGVEYSSAWMAKTK